MGQGRGCWGKVNVGAEGETALSAYFDQALALR
jgi:hypothetical protein